MIVTSTPQPIATAAPDPVRDAATALHRQFVAEMLKQAKLAEAFGVDGSGKDLGGALAFRALDAIADDIVRAQAPFTDSLYAALRRAAPESGPGVT